MNCYNCQYNSFRIIFDVNIFVFGKTQVFDTYCIANFKSGYIYFYFVNQC